MPVSESFFNNANTIIKYHLKPSSMTAHERRREIAVLIARGILRLRQKPVEEQPSSFCQECTDKTIAQPSEEQLDSSC